MAERETRTLRVGISACLLGERVRYDGGHKRDAFLTEVLAPHVEWVPVCPEVELGLGVPRPPIRLVRGRGKVTRLLVETTGEDLTEKMRAYAAWRVRGLASLELDGYVLKSASPSCGLFRVRVHEDGTSVPVGRGLFAEALAEALPHLPMEEESRLAHPSRREHFIERLLAAARWRDFAKRARRPGDLAVFHAAHKYSILAHSPAHWAKLSRLVTAAGRRRPVDVVEDYGTLFMAAVAVRPTRNRHGAVLQQLAGFFERALTDAERLTLTKAIASYRRGRAPLTVPLTLLRDHVRRLGVAHLTDQVYLGPHPSEVIASVVGSAYDAVAPSAASAAASPDRTQSAMPTPR